MITRDEEIAVAVLLAGMCDDNDEAEGKLRRVRKVLQEELIPQAQSPYHRAIRERALEICNQAVKDIKNIV